MDVVEHTEPFDRMAFMNAYMLLAGYMPARSGFGCWTRIRARSVKL